MAINEGEKGRKLAKERKLPASFFPNLRRERKEGRKERKEREEERQRGGRKEE